MSKDVDYNKPNMLQSALILAIVFWVSFGITYFILM